MNQESWDPTGEKQKQLLDQLSGDFKSLSGPATPPAVSGLPPAPPSDSIVTASHETTTPEPAKEEEINADDRTVDSHPATTPDELTPYIKQQEANVDKWGPEKQAALMQNLTEGYKSPGNILAKGGATLADAIMQGVARAGSSGNLAAINERENQSLNRAQEMGKSLNEQNLQGIKSKMGLEGMTSGSPLGSSKALAVKMLAHRMYPDLSEDKLNKLAQNPDALAGIFPNAVEYEKALAEIQGTAAYRAADLDIKRKQLEQTETHQTEQEAETREGHAIERQKEAGEAAKKLADRGLWRRMTDKVTGNPAVKVLERQAESASADPDVVAYASKHGISIQKAQEIKNKRMGQS